MNILRKVICKLLHRKRHRIYWTEFSKHFVECKTCGQNWSIARRTHHITPPRGYLSNVEAHRLPPGSNGGAQ